MAYDMNVFTGIGRLVNDPELRDVGGSKVCKFRMAINRSYNDRTGTPVESTTFISVSTWGKQAETCHRFLKKGRRVAITGELRSNNWEDSNGNKRVSYEISARSVQFLDAKPTDKNTRMPETEIDTDIPDIDSDTLIPDDENPF